MLIQMHKSINMPVVLILVGGIQKEKNPTTTKKTGRRATASACWFTQLSQEKKKKSTFDCFSNTLVRQIT